MDAWERWWKMAEGSLIAAQSLEELGQSRSCASRAYYAAYQSATAAFLYAKLSPPEDREAWSHEVTPRLLAALSNEILNPILQRNLETRLADLYDLRLIADYRGEKEIAPSELRAAVRSAAFIFKILSGIFPEN